MIDKPFYLHLYVNIGSRGVVGDIPHLRNSPIEAGVVFEEFLHFSQNSQD